MHYSRLPYLLVIVTWIEANVCCLLQMKMVLSVTNSRSNSFHFRLLKCIYCWVKYVFNGDSFLPIVMETAWRRQMKKQVQTMFCKWSGSRLKAAIYFHTVSDIAPKMRRNKCEKARENEKRSSLRNDKKWCQNTTWMYILCWHALAETRRCILIKWMLLLSFCYRKQLSNLS